MERYIDVIIPVYRPDKKFHQLLRMLAAQTMTIGRLIVINTDRSLWTEQEAKALAVLRSEKNAVLSAELRHIAEDDFDHAATRRLGVSLSDAPVFVCMTDDAVPADRFLLERLWGGLFQADDIAMAYARQLPEKGCGAAERYARHFNYPEESFVKGKEDIPARGVKTYFASNVCCAYRRDFYDRIGGFCEHAIFNEDMIFAAAAVREDFRIAYCAEARVIHSHNYSGGQQFRRNFDLGMSQAMHPEVFADLPSEGEGMRLVRGTTAWMLKSGRALLLPCFFWRTGCRYLGYRLGKSCRRLPYRLCLILCMNRRYLERHRRELWT